MKKLQQQKQRETVKQQQAMAANLLASNGENYVKTFGPEKLKIELDMIRDGMRMWNGITHSTMVLNLPTVSAMIFILSSVTLNDMSVQNHPKFQEMYMILCAIRNKLIAERDQVIEAQGFVGKKP